MENFDLVIIGGGIHGAVLANYASQNGISTLLLEKNDYASGTSSRSSKMIHGGLRYLELFDFQQVFEGIKAREELFEYAPEIVKPEKFIIPVDSLWFRLKLGIGLSLYDWFVQKKERKHKYIKGKGYEYTDGLANDALLVIENIVRAKQQGAICRNYHEVKTIENSTIQVYDKLTDNNYSIQTKVIINVAGPWVPFLTKSNIQVKYSRGSHILFDKKWDRRSLFLPMEGKSRYYFVWPHPGGTLVGTTERELKEPPDDPLPSPDVIKEIYHRLEKDLPEQELNSDTAYYCFAGVRTLPIRGQAKRNTSRLSRKHIWDKQDNVLSLYGGKLTTASWTAFEGLKVAAKMLGKNNLSYDPKLAVSLDPGLPLEQQVQHLIEHQDAKKLEDVMRRRLFFEYLPGAGIDKLDQICRVQNNFLNEKQQYIDRINKIKLLLKQ